MVEASQNVYCEIKNTTRSYNIQRFVAWACLGNWVSIQEVRCTLVCPLSKPHAFVFLRSALTYLHCKGDITNTPDAKVQKVRSSLCYVPYVAKRVVIFMSTREVDSSTNFFKIKESITSCLQCRALSLQFVLLCIVPHLRTIFGHSYLLGVWDNNGNTVICFLFRSRNHFPKFDPLLLI